MSSSSRPETMVLTRRAARRERLLIGTVLAVSAAGAIVAGWLMVIGRYTWFELALFATMAFVTAAGIEVGFHRLFTHHSFKARSGVRVALAIAGCMAGQGPVAYWVSHHRLHHLHSDEHGDPHSPRLGRAGLLERVAGLLHAHVLWMFNSRRASVGLFARDIVGDPALVFVDRRYWVWLLLGIVGPGFVNLLVTRSLGGFLSGCVFAGLARLFIVNHVVYSVNSVCHTFGSRPFDTGDESRNNALLALPTLGQAWHNNHHAFPSSARMGLTPWQIDVGYWVVAALRRFGGVSEVLVPDDHSVNRRLRREGGEH